MRKSNALLRAFKIATTAIVSVGLIFVGAVAPASAITATHELTANWAAPAPASVLYGNTVIGEWHLNTNDADAPESNADVTNVVATLTATNGKFSGIPAPCAVTGVTPVSSISANGEVLICNLGVVKAGTATVIQTPIRATSPNGGPVSAVGTVNSDTAAAPSAPASLPDMPVTYNFGMDLIIATPSSNPVEGGQRAQYLEGAQRRESMIVDWTIRANDGSRPGPANYSFVINVTSTTPGAVLSGLQFEECTSVDTEVTPGIPFSAPSKPDRAAFPAGCTVQRLSATQYRVNLTGIDYSLTNVPIKDSKGAALPQSVNYLASGALKFSNPYSVTVTTEFKFTATAPNWTYPGFPNTTVDAVANNADTVTLYAPGEFSNRWAGDGTAGRSPWDDQLYVAAGNTASYTLPSPSGTTAGQGLPLYMQATSLAWNDWTGGTQLAALCTMNQTASSQSAANGGGANNNNFVLKYVDGGGFDGTKGGYQQMTTERIWYTTAEINTKTFKCDNSVTWTQVIPGAGTEFKDPRIAANPGAGITGSNVMPLPANVTALRITWNPAVDKPYQVLIRGFGAIKSNAVASSALAGEGWTVGAYNRFFDGAVQFLNNSDAGNIAAATPWSDYTGADGGTNGWRDPFRIVGNTGKISKTASPKEAGPGIPVTYTIKAQTVNTAAVPSGSNITVVDTLPLGMGYIAGSAQIDGVTVTPTITAATASVGQKLTFTIVGSAPNVDRIITYQAQLPLNSTVAPGSTLTNTAVISVPGDAREASLRDASASIVVPNDGTTTFGKSAAAPYVPYAGGSSSWRLTLNSLDPTVNPYTDTIDILPYKGDENGTNIDGGYTVSNVTVPANTWKVYYSTAAPAGINDDPRHTSNGAPNNIAGNTVGWTQITLAGTTATVPAGATALRIIGPALNPSNQQFFTINFTTAAPSSSECSAPGLLDNKPGQVLVNAATSYAGHTRLPMLSSATTTIADCNQIQIKKYVLAKGGNPANAADWHDAQDASDFQQYAPGDTVPYRLTVTNQGTGPLTNVIVTDPMFPQCAFTVATLAAGASSSRDCTAGPAALGTTTNVAFVNVTPPVGAPLSGNDPAGIVVPLAPQITKSSDPASGETVEPGDTITYSIAITEPAESPAPFLNPSFSDSLANVLDDADLVPGSVTVTAVPAGAAGTANVTGSTLNWSAPAIFPGQTITISYQVTVKDPDTGDQLLTNVVTPGTGIDCVVCTTEHGVPGIHFEKTADVAVAHPGDIVTYTITAENTGEVGYTVPDYPASVNDPLTDVLTEADYVAGSATNGATFDPGTGISWSGALAVGATTSFSFQVQIKDPNPGDDHLENRITSTTPGNNCDDESTDPDCEVEVLVQSYTVEKTTAEEPVIRGDVVFYTITVRNTGAVPYTGVAPDAASFADDLTNVLDDATYNNDVTGGATFNSGIISWSGALAVGASKSFTYSVTVTPDPESMTLNNVVEPTGPGGDCAAEGACDTVTPIAEFHVQKSSTPAYTNPGGTVHYTIVVENTGGVAFTDPGFPASFSDSFSGVVDDGELVGLDDDGTIVPGSVTATAGAVSWAGTTLNWSGPIAVGGTVTIEYDVLVDNPDTGDHLLNNKITTPPGFANCDTVPLDPDCETNTPVQSYELVKEADTTVAEVGDTVTYTITVTNTGKVDYPAGPGEPQASLVDAMGDVLLNASFDGNVTASSGTASYDAGTQTISWVGDLPVAGPPVTLTYSVVITSDVTDPDRMVNRADTTAPGGNCDPEVDIDLMDPRCHVQIPTRSYEVVKSVSQSVVEPGTENLTYTITVTNTGAEDYTGTELGGDDTAEIRDSLSDILQDGTNPVVISVPANWSITYGNNPASPNYQALLGWGPLAVGETVTIVYQVDIKDPDTGDHRMENRVTTPPGRGGNCTELSTDPDCDATVLVREFTVEKTVEPEITQVGDTVVYTITVTNTGQVDYDGLTPGTSAGFVDDLSDVLDDATFGSVIVGDATFDAGSEELTWSGALPIGLSLIIRYTVTATGADEHILVNGVDPVGPGGECVDADSCDTTVLIRSYEYSKTATPESTTEGGVVTYTVTIRNTGAVAYTTGDPAGFTDDLSGVFDDAGNLSDITVTPNVGTASASGDSLQWNGPLALPGEAGDEVVITYSVTVDDPDTGDHFLRNGITGIPGTGGECEEEGACETVTPVRSYLVEKSVEPAFVSPGDTVEYTITVTNTGAVAYTDLDPASLSDDLSDVLDVAEEPTGLAVSGDSDNAPTFDSGTQTLNWAGELPVGGTVTLRYDVEVSDPIAAGADYLLENAVTPTGPGGECGDCDTVTPIKAYRTTKTSSPSGEVEAGDVITYTVTVTNLGQVAYSDPLFANFEDDLSDVLDDASGATDLTGGATYDAGTETILWSGALPIGSSVVVTYKVTVLDAEVAEGDGILMNGVLTPPDGGCPTPTTDGCFTVAEVRSLHFEKSVSDDVAFEGDTVEYTITVRNNGAVDFTAGDPAEFDDPLTQLLDDVEDVDAASLALDADSGTATYDTVLHSIHWEGALAAGDTATITYEVQIARPNLGDDQLANTIVTPPGIPSNCADESEDPDCSTTTLVKSFHLEKEADKTEFFPGDVVTYTITLENTGQVAYADPDLVSWSDPLTQVLDDAVYNGDITGGATYDEATSTLSWSGPLAVGETLTYTYSVTVNNPDAGDKILFNRVTNPPDIGGNCEEGSGDPVCEVDLGGPSVHIVKTSDTEEALAGDTVNYSITIENDGGIDWTEERPAELHDDLTDVLDDATFNDDATEGAELDGVVLSWSGPLAVGDSVTIEYSVTINVPVTGNGLMDNVVTTPPEVPSNCTEMPDDGEVALAVSSDPDCTTRTLIKSFVTIKTSDAAGTVKPGDRVTYTVTVVNTGQVPYENPDPAFFEDDFGGVLDDATFADDATDGTTYEAPVLTWEGDLPVGDRTTVTYSFVIKPTGGDNQMINAVFSPFRIGGSCDEATDPDCQTITPIERPLAFTGALVAVPIGLTVLLLGAGGLLFGFSRRRKSVTSA